MRRFAVVLAVAAMLSGACGGGGDDDTGAGSEAGAVDTPAAETSMPVYFGDFEQVCGGGTVAGAAEYSKGPGIHPLIVFEGEDPVYEYRSLTLPEGWQSDLAAQTTELVACLDRVSEKKVNTCTDYESDDAEEPFDVEVYAATWDITLYAATTGEEVASGQIKADSKNCPYLVFFDEDEEVQREYSDMSAQVRSFVKEYVAP